MKTCPNCNNPINGRSDKVFCDDYCKSSFHYKKNKAAEQSFFEQVQKQLKLNRKILKQFNKAGKATVRKEELISEGFNPKFFTHYWKNKKGDVYLFCFEFGFLSINDNGKDKYLLIQWQSYMK